MLSNGGMNSDLHRQYVQDAYVHRLHAHIIYTNIRTGDKQLISLDQFL